MREGGKPNCRARNESAIASETPSQSVKVRRGRSCNAMHAMALIKYARPPLKVTLLVIGMDGMSRIGPPLTSPNLSKRSRGPLMIFYARGLSPPPPPRLLSRRLLDVVAPVAVVRCSVDCDSSRWSLWLDRFWASYYLYAAIADRRRRMENRRGHTVGRGRRHRSLARSLTGN